MAVMKQLGEVAEIFVGVPTRGGDLTPTGRSGNMLTVRALTGTGINPDEILSLNIPEHEFGRYRIQAGDVLVSARSTSLRSAIVPKELAGNLINATILGIRTLPKLEPRLLVAWLEHPEGRAALESVAQSGTAQMNITVAAISKIMVPVPPLPAQRQMAKILEAADEAYHAATQAAEDRRRIARQVVVAQLNESRKH